MIEDFLYIKKAFIFVIIFFCKKLSNSWKDKITSYMSLLLRNKCMEKITSYMSLLLIDWKCNCNCFLKNIYFKIY
jgi:hypothetical protein